MRLELRDFQHLVSLHGDQSMDSASQNLDMPQFEEQTVATYKGTMIEPLNIDNIHSWLEEAKSFLIAEGHWEYIDPRTVEPHIYKAEMLRYPDKEKSELSMEVRKEAHDRLLAAREAIKSLMLPDTWSHFHHVETAADIWMWFTLSARGEQKGFISDNRGKICLPRIIYRKPGIWRRIVVFLTRPKKRAIYFW